MANMKMVAMKEDQDAELEKFQLSYESSLQTLYAEFQFAYQVEVKYDDFIHGLTQLANQLK